MAPSAEIRAIHPRGGAEGASEKIRNSDDGRYYFPAGSHGGIFVFCEGLSEDRSGDVHHPWLWYYRIFR